MHNVHTIPLLNGLILVGGRSSRMGRDKWAMRYHGKTEPERLHNLLASRCRQVYISARPDQLAPLRETGLPLLPDGIDAAGPLGGVLTAMRAEPDAAWLVVACDMPLLDAATLDQLISGRDPACPATAMYRQPDAPPEPLCAIYEPTVATKLAQALAADRLSLRDILKQTSTCRVIANRPEALHNVNDPEAAEKMRSSLGNS